RALMNARPPSSGHAVGVIGQFQGHSQKFQFTALSSFVWSPGATCRTQGNGTHGKPFVFSQRPVLPPWSRRSFSGISRSGGRGRVPPCLPIPYPGGNRPEGQRRRGFLRTTRFG